MKKYKVLIMNCVVLFLVNAAISFASRKASVIFMWVCFLFLVVSTISMIFLKSFGNSSSYTLSTWKNIRNLVLYITAVLLGSMVVYAL